MAQCQDGTVIRHPTGRTGLAGMILEVWYEQVYTGQFYTPVPGDVIIDAGANIGLFSLLIARTHPGCRVMAFEPFEENYRILSENLAAAHASMVKAFPCAISGTSGEFAMIDGGVRSQDHRLKPLAAGASTGPTIRAYSLTEVLGLADVPSIALFKCDIEGSEYDLFASATAEELKRFTRYAIEYHDNLRPGTLALLKERLSPTHTLDVRSAPQDGYGMLYAVAKTS